MFRDVTQYSGDVRVWFDNPNHYVSLLSSAFKACFLKGKVVVGLCKKLAACEPRDELALVETCANDDGPHGDRMCSAVYDYGIIMKNASRFDRTVYTEVWIKFLQLDKNIGYSMRSQPSEL